MRIILYSLLVLLSIVSVTSLEECQRVMVATDLDCNIITDWAYPNACNTYIVKFYNASPTLIASHVMSDYGTTDFCNVSVNITHFNYSGSYTFNITGGDSGGFAIEVDENMNIAIVIALSVFAALFIVIGFVMWLMNKGQGTDD